MAMGEAIEEATESASYQIAGIQTNVSPKSSGWSPRLLRMND
jgi:hypothetical protein